MLTDKVFRERGFGCASYKERCLRRRIAVRMRARGVHTYEDYARVLDGDSFEYDRLLDALTINVTRLFRNGEVFTTLAARVIPELWSVGAPRLRMWSAGCSSGEEPYSLAALVHTHAVTQRDTSALSRVEIIGTDVHGPSLEAAAEGAYGANVFDEVPAEVRAAYFSAGPPPFRVSGELRRLVRFETNDLLRDEAPGSGFSLIACRNVLIYFDRESQERLFEHFHAALAPGGFLVLGMVETLFGEARRRFATIDARTRIFRRL
ncbi:MAG TPA: protein-glutamate O-methyltransferase CheR [Candidatus Saccharimonadia bacterium]|nr:protein-glutamate O-methyltransferase CheR [Candidatus Saccharimonadia bacterium]